MAIGQSNMFSAPGDTQLGGNEQLAGASQPKAPSMGIFDTTAPVGQTMNQMQQSQLSPGLFGGFSERDKQAQLRAASDPSSMFFDPRRSTPPMIPPSGIRNPFTGQIIGQPPMMPPSGIGGLRPPPFGGFRPTNPIMNPTPPMMPPGGIGGFPPSFRPPGMPPGIGRPPIMPPGMGRPPIMPPGIGRPPGMPPGGIGGFPPSFRPPSIGRPPIFGRPPIMPPGGIRNPFTGQIIGRGLGLGSPIMAMDSETPMLGGTPMPPITDEVG